jgi:hypothetical protein
VWGSFERALISSPRSIQLLSNSEAYFEVLENDPIFQDERQTTWKHRVESIRGVRAALQLKERGEARPDAPPQ